MRGYAWKIGICRTVVTRVEGYGGVVGRRGKGCVELGALEKKSGITGCRNGALKPEEVA